MKTPFLPTDEQITAAETLFMAMAYVETIKPMVEKIQQDILTKNNYRYLPEDNILYKHRDKIQEEKGGELPQYIKSHNDIHLMGKGDSGHYFTELNHAYISAGFNVEFGYCPLLVAEDMVRQGRKLLIDVMQPITKLSYEAVAFSKDCVKNIYQLAEISLKLLAPYCKVAA